MVSSIDVEIREGDARLPGVLVAPPHASHLVVFAHGSGSSRLSPRNVTVAEALQHDGLGTLLFDLLTDREAAERRNVFDIGLLARRLLAAVEFVRARNDVGELPVALFGASTGGGAAIVAAASLPAVISSVVSRGGRPDLAGSAVETLRTPTLFIVGASDEDVLRLNRATAARITGAETRLEVVPGATHLFEEPGALERVSALASAWIRAH